MRRDGEAGWVAGPLRQTPTLPPIGLRWSYETGMLELDVIASWSPWIDDPAGAAQLAQATAGLLAAGWDR